MKNSLFLLLFLSVLSFNSKTSFGQGLKKDLGVCGIPMSVVMRFEKNHEPLLESALLLKNNDEYCDNGRYEDNANYIISLYNDKNTLVYDKHVFLNTILTFEKGDEKKIGKFKSTKLLSKATSRIVKFPVNPSMGNVTSYKIEAIHEKKATEMKKFIWVRE